MLDLHWIRHNPNQLDDMLLRRGYGPMAQEILELDEAYRRHLTELQRLQADKNRLDQQAVSVQREKAFMLKQAIEVLKEEKELSYKKLFDQWVLLPNMLDPSVPDGKSELDNQEVLRWGEPVSASWMQNHVTLGMALDGLDFAQARIVSGARFVYLKKDLARLERALAQWMLDVHTQHFGFVEMVTPYLVREEAMFNAGQLPKFRDDLFCTTEGFFLIPTAEVSLVNWASHKTLSPSELPLCLTALTPCFRSEAGSAGKDTQGMIRQHQFHKVELVVVCAEADAASWHEKMTLQAESLLQSLGLPYRKMLLCAADTGITAQKTYDLEVWIPSQQRYREIASCSRCGDYQARRLKTKDQTGTYLHTLNGSGLPTGRTLIALLENGQREDGSVLIPEVLHPYMGGVTLLQRDLSSVHIL